jgi:hypothetical protein
VRGFSVFYRYLWNERKKTSTLFMKDLSLTAGRRRRDPGIHRVQVQLSPPSKTPANDLAAGAAEIGVGTRRPAESSDAFYFLSGVAPAKRDRAIGECQRSRRRNTVGIHFSPRYETVRRLTGHTVLGDLMSDTKKCAHPTCNCPAQKSSDYCSTYCEGKGDIADIECSCGHEGCAPIA